MTGNKIIDREIKDEWRLLNNSSAFDDDYGPNNASTNQQLKKDIINNHHKESNVTSSFPELDNEEKIDSMKSWFLENYGEPVNILPYNSRDGGYIPIFGNLVHPLDILSSEYHEEVDDSIIERLAYELESIAPEWTPLSDEGTNDVTPTKSNTSINNERKKNPNWDEVELFLILNLYIQKFPSLPEITSTEVIELSNLLREYHTLLNHEITSTLRNPNGVFMKLRNFESLDNRTERTGLKSVSSLDKKMWEKYNISKKLLSKYDIYIKQNIKQNNLENLNIFFDKNISEEDRLKIVEEKIISEKYSNQIGKHISEKIFDKHKNPVLNIKSVAKVFSKYIIKYNAEYTSTIIGVFAKWGRGKTFFYEQLKNDIQNEKQNIYFCEFQPWKYQKQESAWAYLYEKVLNNYLENKQTPLINKISELEKSIREKFDKKCITDKLINGTLDYIEPEKLYKIFLLNKTRIGIGNLILGLTSILFLFTWIVIPIEWKFNAISWIIGVLGLTGSIILYKSYSFYMKSKGTVADLITHYGKTKDYSNHLGFQNEIEKELRYLINTYITEEDERLILFIDDLDRCDEKMIINIMDSLRLVLEDKEINKKLTIITAIDERILLKSIKHKYFNKDDISENCDISPREYIEKFFLIALKLNHLNDTDKIELVEEYTAVFNSPFNQSKSPTVSAIEKIQNNEELNEIEKAFVKEEPLKEYVKNNNLKIEGNSITLENKTSKETIHNLDLEEETKDLKALNSDEVDYIKKLILIYNIDTPRKINMMIQRYLLFKNFIFEELGYESSNYKLYISLIFYALKPRKFNKLIKKYEDTKDEEIEFSIKKETFKENRKRFIILVKYAEMVSPF